MSIQKTALVTGISSGIGAATANLLAANGFTVFGTVRNTADQQNVVPVEILTLDVRDETSVQQCVDQALKQAGRIDVLVNNAGFSVQGAIEETSIEQAKAMFETNVFGVLRMTQAVLPIMRRQGSGRIVNISSVLGFLPAPFHGIYAASKHALEGLTESLDHEVRGFGIRACLIEPSYTRTHLNQKGQSANNLLPAYAAQRERVIQHFNKRIDTGVEPETVARVILQAATVKHPQLRYPAGTEAKRLSILRRFVPSSFFGKALRKEFQLDSAR